MSPPATDLRDVYLPGGGPSRLTLRRLLVLVRGLGPDSLTWMAYERSQGEQQRHDNVRKLRERTAYYEQQKAG